VPESSNERNPQVQYPSGGRFPVRLIVRNNLGSDTAAAEDYVQIYQATPNSALGLRESFESFIPADFEMRVMQADTWRRTANAAAAGTFSLMVPNNRNKRGFRYQLVSKPVDASALPAIFSFRYAYMPRWNANLSGPTNDALSVRVSGDCGRTWIGRFNAAAGNLATLPGSPFSYEFIPAGREAWREVNVNLSSLNASVRANMQVMIEFVSDGGNNFFLDDIRWTQALANAAVSAEPARIYPNPASEIVQIELPASVDGAVDITLREIAGGRIIQVQRISASAEPINFDLPDGIAAGAYIIDIRSREGAYRFLEKLLVE